MQQFVCLPYQLMRSAVGVIVVLAQLQNHCRSRETCSFGTPDAVVCRAARSASAVLAAVGPSVGIGSASRMVWYGICMYELVAQRDGGGVAVLWIGLAADSSLTLTLFMVHPKLMILHAIYE